MQYAQLANYTIYLHSDPDQHLHFAYLDAVLAFYKAGSGDGLAWMISSNRNVTSSSQARGVPSFTFESHLHRFYNPHDAQLIEETDAASGATTTSLLLFDDGNNRRGCDEMDEHCYSRAVKYSLDFETYAATLTWQFAWPSVPSSSADEATAQERARQRLSSTRMADEVYAQDQ